MSGQLNRRIYSEKRKEGQHPATQMRWANHPQRRPAWPGSLSLTAKGARARSTFLLATDSTDTRLASSSPSGFYASSQHCNTSQLNLELNCF